jgi:hypothetical protein
LGGGAPPHDHKETMTMTTTTAAHSDTDPMRCDFCASPGVRWWYPTDERDRRARFACSKCHAAIEADDREGLLLRASLMPSEADIAADSIISDAVCQAADAGLCREQVPAAAKDALEARGLDPEQFDPARFIFCLAPMGDNGLTRRVEYSYLARERKRPEAAPVGAPPTQSPRVFGEPRVSWKRMRGPSRAPQCGSRRRRGSRRTTASNGSRRARASSGSRGDPDDLGDEPPGTRRPSIGGRR